VAGYGIAGLAAAAALANRDGPASVTVWGRVLPEVFAAGFEDLAQRGVELVVGGDGLELLEDRLCVIKSPGIPDEEPLIAAATETRGVDLIDEAELGWRLTDRPLIGVTGTNGKSTVCALIAAVLEATGTPAVVAGNVEGGPALSGVSADAAVVVGELSSFQLRHSPHLLPDLAVLTNCTHDSWHRHGGQDGYERDKERIALRDDLAARHAVLPADDPLGRRLAPRVCAAGGTVTTFGFSESADCRIRACDWDLRRAILQLELAGRVVELEAPFPGEHNARNLAAALATVVAWGIDLDVAAAALAAARPVPGRLEPAGAPSGFDVLVDYAHNPDGLRQTLATVRHVLRRRGRGRLIAVVAALPVFSADQYAEMGSAAAAADVVFATTERLRPDAPLEEPPEFFAALRETGVELTVEVDRRRAIDRAVTVARPGDVVLVLGRGRRRTPIHVPGEEPLTVDDREQARAAIARLAA
jgi:UDP-N-acetylmuramoyl-L-alanyl-D-glutamate--2,6-diaminopimelate ligase